MTENIGQFSVLSLWRAPARAESSLPHTLAVERVVRPVRSDDDALPPSLT
ncbi:hypothetical protein [Kocuria sp.]|nr:hypothetical protein [Kocuria sp.]MDO5619181.1 hypothetical protein [Kocuria sp.]